MPDASRPNAVLPLTLGVVAISFAAVLFRLADDVDPIVASAWRLVVAGLLLAPFIVRAARRGRAAPLGIVLVTGLAYALHFGAWVASLGLTSVAVSTTAVTTTPLMLALMALLSGRDRPSARIWLAMALGLGGVALMSFATPAARHAGSDHPLGVALALVGAAAMAGYLLVVRRLLARRPSVDVLALQGGATLAGGAMLLVAALVTNRSVAPPSFQSALVVVGAALLPQVVGHSLLTLSLRRTTPTIVGLATLGEPVVASLLAALLLAEPLTWPTALACLIVLGSVALALSGGGESKAT